MCFKCGVIKTTRVDCKYIYIQKLTKRDRCIKFTQFLKAGLLKLMAIGNKTIFHIDNFVLSI